METNQQKLNSHTGATAPPRIPRGIMFAVLRLIHTLGLRASGTEICKHISAQLDRDLPAAQIYISLSRLEDQALVVAENEQKSSSVRKGRPRRVYRLTDAGLQALDAGMKLYNSMAVIREENILDGVTAIAPTTVG